jgi:hypothetical protein
MSTERIYYNFNISSFYSYDPRSNYEGNENTLKFKGSKNYNTLSLNSTIPVGVFNTNDDTPNYKILSNPLYKSYRDRYRYEELLELIEEVYDKYTILNSKIDLILQTKCAYEERDKFNIELDIESFFHGNNNKNKNNDIIYDSIFDVNFDYYIQLNTINSNETFIITNNSISKYSYEECTKIIIYFENKYSSEEYNNFLSLDNTTHKYLTKLINLQLEDNKLKANEICKQDITSFCIYCNQEFNDDDMRQHIYTNDKCKNILSKHSKMFL